MRSLAATPPLAISMLWAGQARTAVGLCVNALARQLDGSYRARSRAGKPIAR